MLTLNVSNHGGRAVKKRDATSATAVLGCRPQMMDLAASESHVVCCTSVSLTLPSRTMSATSASLPRRSLGRGPASDAGGGGVRDGAGRGGGGGGGVGGGVRATTAFTNASAPRETAMSAHRRGAPIA